VHLPGLEKWVFPELEATGPKRIPIPRNYRDLAEMFESRTEEYGRRVAFRVLRKDDVADSYTYRDVRRAAHAVAEFLREHGVKPGDRVMLASEGRPEWGMSYFGIILAGATAVPVDVDLSEREMTNIARSADVKGAIASEKLVRTLAGGGNGAPSASNGAEAASKNGGAQPMLVEAARFPAAVWSFDQVFANAHRAVQLRKPQRRPEDVASIIFTSGTTGRPKGVMLTDRNFTGLTSRMAALFELNRTDSLLSVLPPHHTFEFSAGLLMPFWAGASITYLEERTPELISRAFKETPVTGMIGVPAVWESLHRKINNEVTSRGRIIEGIIHLLMRANRTLRDRTRWNIGRWIFSPMHNALGGRLRYLVSGGAPLKPALFKDLHGMGFNIYEGYGLTEASPVITVGWPRMKTPPGSVGWPLPGVEVRIHQANELGIGEVIARGPTIMEGYLDDPEGTDATIRDGWLFTGDQGRIDEEGRLYIVGRQKDVIIDTGGKNVYPDEIEELYQGSPFVKDLSVVGVPAERGTGERVAALVVPDYEAKEAIEQGLQRDQIREKIREHFRDVGSKLPLVRRVKVMHIWDGELPKTSTRKVKRNFVREQIMRLERTLVASRQSATEEKAGGAALPREDRPNQVVKRTIASIAQRGADQIRPDLHLVDSLGFDSLMHLELLTALESEFPRARISPEEMATAETVGDVVRLASRDRGEESERLEEVGNREEAPPFHVPDPIARAGKTALGWLQHLSYDRFLDVEVDGRGNIPANRNFIVAANHASHLDMGLVKYALGDMGKDIQTLAARDYFFADTVRRTYFENFTNLLPIDRHGSLKKSLRLASDSLRRGSSLLIFPEGTRARDGVITRFKPAIGHLALNERVDIVPMFLGGTYDSLPVGAVVPKKRELYVRIGDPITAEEMIEKTRGMPRSAAYRAVADRVEAAVRMLGGLEPMDEHEADDKKNGIEEREGDSARESLEISGDRSDESR
jgi:long-chain acyl-CoA synthetase